MIVVRGGGYGSSWAADKGRTVRLYQLECWPELSRVVSRSTSKWQKLMGNREFPIFGPITANYTTRCEGTIPVLLPPLLILLGRAIPRFDTGFAVMELKRRKVKPERFGIDGELENKARLARFGSSPKTDSTKEDDNKRKARPIT
ncbi:hypothetical protein BUALT_Bualt14G0006600 [Buddleja alternifolia]|uniref:Uncharacterized protein n=1 Tax=Buddleja alternifolia TaxID=168488 RepID=A0AAV6WNF5_9LAMI|nr:hypothetical protein BUALT_Bualt14G0006600 [Buddleja alternifolia]